MRADMPHPHPANRRHIAKAARERPSYTGVAYDPELSGALFPDWREVGRKPGDTKQRGVVAFLRDNLFS